MSTPSWADQLEAHAVKMVLQYNADMALLSRTSIHQKLIAPIVRLCNIIAHTSNIHASMYVFFITVVVTQIALPLESLRSY